MTLENQRAVVSGAGSGIGKAIAIEFAKAGAKLVLTDINPATLIAVAELCKQEGAEVITVISDISSPTGAIAGVNRCIMEFEGIDILVNNAGILTQALCEDISLKMWEDMINIDLRSVFLASQAAIPHMKKQQHGRIINISSQLGIKGGAELCHYVAAKAGVIGLTKSLAIECASHGVLVNAIAPGPIETPLVDGISSAWKVAKAKELPLGRFGKAEEIAPTALLLASSPGGNLFVGQTLGPNSGDVMP